MTSGPWRPSVFLHGDIADEVARIKQQPGPDLHVWGSGNLLQILIEHDLVDVFWVMIYPITLGAGRSLSNSARICVICRWIAPAQVFVG